MKVKIWTTNGCVQCMQTKKQFDKLGIIYEEESLETNQIALEGFKAMGLLQAPIVETDSKRWSGFRIDKIQSLARHLKSMGEINE
jgi:glutaredoxin-like protein NrdH